jgi:tetratricopeptide (TPR) repeat protein
VLFGPVRYEEALVAFDRALALDPQYPHAWNNKGVSLENLRRYQDALYAYEQAIHCDPQDGEYWRNKGDVLTGLGRAAEAQQAYAQARALGYSW